MVESVAIFLSGILVWTFLEYVIHGWLSHTFRTFAQPLHQVHHKDPRAVFTIGAWVPIALTWIGLFLAFGSAPGVILFSGIVVGFAAYEVVHYRIHFRVPTRPIEQYLRSRHLLHHAALQNRCFGVTSALWDLSFGTEALMEDRGRNQSIGAQPPLTGPTNLYKLRDYLRPFARKRVVASSQKSQ